MRPVSNGCFVPCDWCSNWELSSPSIGPKGDDVHGVDLTDDGGRVSHEHPLARLVAECLRDRTLRSRVEMSLWLVDGDDPSSLVRHPEQGEDGERPDTVTL